jgi:menaquinone-9 beta-reductase
MQADVAVVGGGPAGSAAAITLARAGRRVVVVDKARFPRDKCCGDGLTAGALRMLDGLGLDPAAVASWQAVEEVVVRPPSGRTVVFPLPGGTRGAFAAVARRVDLDAALVNLARAAGATVVEGAALRAATEDADGVTLDVDGPGELRVPFAIGADGMWSPLRKALGATVPGYRGDWHAFRQYFRHVGPAAGHLTVWFEPDLLPGYAWSFPLPGRRANVGFGILRGSGQVERVQDMGRLWPDLLERPHIRAVLGPDAVAESRHLAWPIPAQLGQVPLHTARALFVGDAAALTDPMTGEGIGQALLSGVLAARAILAGPGPHDRSADGTVTAHYREAVNHEMGADHRLSLALTRVLQGPRGADLAVRLAGATGWTRRSFARWLFEDEPRAALLTPGRWHRRFLRGDGAWADGRCTAGSRSAFTNEPLDRNAASLA